MSTWYIRVVTNKSGIKNEDVTSSNEASDQKAM